MRTTITMASVLLLSVWGEVGRADPTPPSRPSLPTVCTVTLPAATIVASFDGSMAGTLNVDGAAVTRRFKIKSTPYSATYLLMFKSYGEGDKKPTTEAFSGKSIVARIVLIGTTMHLLLDSDYLLPGARPTMDGYLCKEPGPG